MFQLKKRKLCPYAGGIAVFELPGGTRLLGRGGGLENSLQPKFTALRPFDHDESIFMRIPSAKTKEHAFDEESFLFFQNATNWWVTK